MVQNLAQGTVSIEDLMFACSKLKLEEILERILKQMQKNKLI